MKDYRQNITSCIGCPNHRYLRSEDTVIDYCRSIGRQIGDIHMVSPFTMPDWCPLPEVKKSVSSYTILFSYEDDLERKLGVILKDAMPHFDSEYVGIGGMSGLIERIITEVKIHMVRSG